MESFEQEEHVDQDATEQESAPDSAPEPAPDPTPAESSGEEAPSESEGETQESSPEESSAPAGDAAGEPAAGGLLTGTGSEQEPGVGGTGDHPAPAAVKDGEGGVHVAGEAPAGDTAGTQSPVGDEADLQSGDIVTDPEARERLGAAQEPEQVQTTRPDLGTPE